MRNHPTKMDMRSIIASACIWADERFSHADLEHCLRSIELNPNFDFYDKLPTERQRTQIVADLSRKRIELLQQRGINLVTKLDGRIVCYYPSTLGDCLSYEASSGYLSKNEAPPWDTWLFYQLGDVESVWGKMEPCLYSWVPQSVVTMMDNLIDDDPHYVWAWANKFEKEYGITHG